MYHKPENFQMFYPYYDTVEEMPEEVTVKFPDGTTRKMTTTELDALSDEGYYAIQESSNYGCCDHWTATSISRWVIDNFRQIIRYVDKNDKTVGYNRRQWCVWLTKDKHYFKSSVWN